MIELLKILGATFIAVGFIFLAGLFIRWVTGAGDEDRD